MYSGLILRNGASQLVAILSAGVALTLAPHAEAQVTDRAFKANPNVNEARVGHYSLPDPLLTLDGNHITSVAQWESVRRPEIMHLFAQNQFGVTPDGGPQARFDVWESGVTALKGKALRTQVRIRFSDAPDSPVIRLVLYTPADAKGPVPVLQHLSFSPSIVMIDDAGIEEGHAWDTIKKVRIPGREGRKVGEFNPVPFLEKGIGVALVYYGDIEPDFQGGEVHGVRSLFEKPKTVEPDPTKPPVASTQVADWGAIGAWSWGMSRVLDYLQTDKRVDGKRVAVSGASRLGKTILWAAAQDQRFAVVLPLISGEGGAALSRRNYGETIADLTHPERYPYWFTPAYADWAQKVDRFPVDGHMLLALIAPRPVLQVVGETDTWSDPRGEYLAARAAEPVYSLYGKTGLQSPQEPETGRLILNDMGFYKHDGGHEVLPVDIEAMIAFMQKHFGLSQAGQRR